MTRHTEYFVKIILRVDGDEEMEVDVANDSFSETERFVQDLHTEEGVQFYLDSIDFDAEFVSFDNSVYRRDIEETLVARVSMESY